MTITWTKRPTELDVAGYANALAAGTVRVAEVFALILEADAKLNRPWADDTGAARAGLTGFTQRDAQRVRIILAHRVDYGVFLELARAGRYAILWPTIQRNLPELKRLLEDMAS